MRQPAFAVVVTIGYLFLNPGISAAQSVPSSCDGINYDCMAMGTTPWEYHHNTCFVQEHRATEAESLQDEIDEYTGGGVCELTTERVGWHTGLT